MRPCLQARRVLVIWFAATAGLTLPSCSRNQSKQRADAKAISSSHDGWDYVIDYPGLEVCTTPRRLLDDRDNARGSEWIDLACSGKRYDTVILVRPTPHDTDVSQVRRRVRDGHSRVTHLMPSRSLWNQITEGIGGGGFWTRTYRLHPAIDGDECALSVHVGANQRNVCSDRSATINELAVFLLDIATEIDGLEKRPFEGCRPKPCLSQWRDKGLQTLCDGSFQRVRSNAYCETEIGTRKMVITMGGASPERLHSYDGAGRWHWTQERGWPEQSEPICNEGTWSVHDCQ